jgi:asparagine synthase (glutamine-hydrolysing)
MVNFIAYTGHTNNVDKMLQALKHNVYHHENSWQDSFCKLAALSCYTLPNEDKIPQPYQVEDWVVVADCRIDNREELAQVFKWDNFEDKADVEFIVEAFKVFGNQCCAHLIGDFVFVIYTISTRQIFAGRDHLGVRTLYYTLVNNNLVFSTEIKGVLAHSEVVKQWNEEFIAYDFSLVEYDKNLTLYQGIQMVPPGHFLEFKNSRISFTKYWDLSQVKKTTLTNQHEIEAEFKRLFFKAVKNRLRCVGNLGSEVSGGLDSTGIAAVALEQMEDKHKMFTYSFGKTQEAVSQNLHADDNDIVEEMCLKYDVANNWVIMRDDAMNVQDIVDLQLNVLDEPENNGVPLLSSYFLKHAKDNGVKMMFSGWAGDQVVTNTVGGFYDNLALRKKYVSLFIDIHRKHNFIKTVPRFVWYAIKNIDSNSQLKRYKKLNKSFVNYNVLNDAVNQKYKLYQQPSLRFHLKNKINIQEYFVRNLLHSGIHNRTIMHFLLGKHFGVEYRFPMLDVPLIEFNYSLPLEAIAYQGKNRYLFSKIIKPYVPAKTVNMKKSRFPTAPFAPTFTKKIFKEAIDLVRQNQTPVFQSFFNAEKITRFENNPNDNARDVKKLLFYSLKIR